MSISVKNIAVSIDGTPSEQFYIKLYDNLFLMESFSLTQHLLEPCFLSFDLHKDTEESIDDINFNVCANIIGAHITLLLQTESTEKDMEGFEEESQNGDIEFEGLIINATANRASDKDYVISVRAMTYDGMMMNAPTCWQYIDSPLKDILSDIAVTGHKLQMEGEIAYQKAIHYTVKYNESDHDFLARLARRYGEWMFHTGKKLHFGKLENQESIRLKYPNQDVTNYSVRLQTCYQRLLHIQPLYNAAGNAQSTSMEDAQKPFNHLLNDSVFEASKSTYLRDHIFNVAPGTGMETDKQAKEFKLPKTMDELPPFHEEEARSEIHATRGNMVVYSGDSYCSRLKIGAKLTIDDYFISGEEEKKSDVAQDEILITGVDHFFNVNLEYRNSFEGIPSVIDFPPYYDACVYPRCYAPVRATVIDNDDPEGWGRIRVRFPWQLWAYHEEHGTKDANGVSPWLHVIQPYTGASKDAGGFFGTYLLPEIFTEVLVAFEEGNVERPFVMGSHFSNQNPVDPKWIAKWNNVKAFRTASGHTIEIHDTETDTRFGEKGYIRVYDNYHHTYELLLSTDRALIKLKSAGNIELDAGKDINITAGHSVNIRAKEDYVTVYAKKDVTITAHQDIRERARNDIALSCERNIETYSQEKTNMQADTEMNVVAVKNLKLRSDSEEAHFYGKKLVRVKASDKDGQLTAGGEVNIEAKTLTGFGEEKVKMGGTADGLEIAQGKIGLKTTNATVEGMAGVELKSTAKIDLNAPIVNEP